MSPGGRAGAPSPVGAALRLAFARLRPGAATAAPAKARSPRRRVAVERTGLVADEGAVRRYLAATRGESLPALSRSPTLLPPLYPARWEAALALELFTAAGLPFPSAGLVHLGGELIQLRPLTVGEAIRCRAELVQAEQTARGMRVEIGCRSWGGRGQLCREDRVELLVRGAGGGPPLRPRPVREPPDWQELDAWELDARAGRRYARASGDYNPIHLWRWTARPFGYRQPILHGFCLEAMVAHTLITRRFGGDAEALRRVRIAFRAPLPLPTRVRLLVAAGEGDGGVFRVVPEAAGSRAVAEGEFVGEPASEARARQG